MSQPSFPLEPVRFKSESYDGTGGLSPNFNAPELLPLNNQKLRKLLRQKRRHLSVIEQRQHSKIITQRLIHSRLYKRARSIALYLSGDGEVNLAALVHKIASHNKHCYLPVILSRRHGLMKFAPYRHDMKLKKNCFGIKEPVCRRSFLKKASQLDLILSPLVAFDQQGNRMGMGGGFYDRALQITKQRKHRLRPVFVGVAHSLQKVEQLEKQSWDIALDAIVTEKEFRFFNSH